MVQIYTWAYQEWKTITKETLATTVGLPDRITADDIVGFSVVDVNSNVYAGAGNKVYKLTLSGSNTDASYSSKIIFYNI